MTEPKMGGKPTLRLFLTGGDDVTNSLLSVAEGGQKLDRGHQKSHSHCRYQNQSGFPPVFFD